MRLLLFIMLGSFILVGCSQEDSPENANRTQEEASEEKTADNSNEEEESRGESTEEQAGDRKPEGSDSEEDSKEEAEEEPPVDLMADVTFKEGFWINYSGEDDSRGHMARTDFISYDPKKDYSVTASSYVSYYYGEEFIKTNNYGHNVPLVIEKVPEADRLIVSVENQYIDDVGLYDAALEDAEKDGEVNTTPEERVGRGKLDPENLTGQIMFGQDFLSEENLMRDERIDDKGNFVEEEDYAVTESLEYNPSTDYAISVPASISYYSGSNFIETIEIEETPAYIPQVTGADYINISFEEE